MTRDVTQHPLEYRKIKFELVVGRRWNVNDKKSY